MNELRENSTPKVPTNNSSNKEKSLPNDSSSTSPTGRSPLTSMSINTGTPQQLNKSVLLHKKSQLDQSLNGKQSHEAMSKDDNDVHRISSLSHLNDSGIDLSQ